MRSTDGFVGADCGDVRLRLAPPVASGATKFTCTGGGGGADVGWKEGDVWELFRFPFCFTACRDYVKAKIARGLNRKGYKSPRKMTLLNKSGKRQLKSPEQHPRRCVVKAR